MPRLIDDLRATDAKLAKPHFVPPWKQEAWANLAKQTHSIIMDPQLPVLLIDNVAEYFYTSDQEYWDLKDHFPNIAPPYPAFWCEHRMVKKIHSEECGDTDVSALVPHGRIGALIHGLDPAQTRYDGELPGGTRWLLWCELFIDYGWRGVTAMGPHGSTFLCVDGDGVIVDRPWMQSLAADDDEEANANLRGYMTWFNPMFLAVSFLHCKNVTLVDNTVPKPLAKKYFTRHGVMPCSYKTLIIEPLRKILRTEGGSDQVGLPKAMHICRGHFRDYREGRGLFGKLHGEFWIPATVRGTKGKAKPREIEVKL